MNQNQLKKDWDTLQNDFARLTTDISHMWKRMAGSPRDEFVEVKCPSFLDSLKEV